MKRFTFAVLGLLALLATVITLHWAVSGDSLFAYAVPAGFGYGMYCAFRTAGRVPAKPKAPRPAPAPAEPRPWEH